MNAKFSACKMLLVATVAVLLMYPESDAGGKKSDSEVKVTAKAKKGDAPGKQVVTIDMEINKGWHIYANPVENEDLAGAQTTVKVDAKTKPKQVRVIYPDGILKKDATVGDYRIYKQNVQIEATIVRDAGDTSPLEVSVRFMACHEKGVCLQPATVKLMVP